MWQLHQRQISPFLSSRCVIILVWKCGLFANSNWQKLKHTLNCPRGSGLPLVLRVNSGIDGMNPSSWWLCDLVTAPWSQEGCRCHIFNPEGSQIWISLEPESVPNTSRRQAQTQNKPREKISTSTMELRNHQMKTSAGFKYLLLGGGNRLKTDASMHTWINFFFPTLYLLLSL